MVEESHHEVLRKLCVDIDDLINSMKDMIARWED